VDPTKYEEEIEGKRIYLFEELLMEAFRAVFLNVTTTPGGNSVSVFSKYRISQPIRRTFFFPRNVI
jgi:hypothetical protein